MHSGIGIVDRGVEKVLLELSKRLSKRFALTLFTGGLVSDTQCHPISTLSRNNRSLNFAYNHAGNLARRIITRLHLDPPEFEKFIFSVHAVPHLLRNRFDIVMVATGFWGAVTGKIIRGLVGSRLICRTGGWKQSAYESAQFKPDAHIVDNPEVAEFLQQRLPTLPITCISNGIDLNHFLPGPSRISVGLQKPIFLCVGWFEPVKQMQLAIEAVARLDSGSLILLGAGALEKEWRQMGEKKLGSHRFLMRSATFSEVKEYYKLCDVFTLPSGHEAFGLVYLEALACNKPVVAPNDRVRKTIVGQAGKLCDCEDINAYAQTLEQVAQHNFGNAPRQQAKKFGWSQIADLYAEAIQKVLK